MKIRRKLSERGMILFTVMLMTGALMLLVGSMLTMGHSAIKSVRQWRMHDTSLLKAQSLMGKTKYELFVKYQTYFNAAPGAKLSGKFNWFDSWSSSSVGSSSAYSMPVNSNLGDGYTGTVTLLSEANTGRASRTLGMQATVTAPNGTQRRVYELVRYRLAPSQVFDYAYFVNNFGWFYGSTITAHGNVRANGNFAFQSNPKVNGDVTAAVNAAIAAPGSVSGTWNFDTTASYRNNAPVRARPTDPPSATYTDTWSMGYNGAPVQKQYNPVLEMPYISDLTDYEYYANEANGRIKIGNTTVVDKVYSGSGPDGVAGTADDGTVVLVGTSANPIEITGPVVVRGDVIIKGVVKGQGTIYAGRNVHIADNITYKDPPTWTHPDNTPKTTVTQNGAKDLLGLAAKGNIILGNYRDGTWQSNTNYYMSPSFTEPYDTEASDASIGYDSDNNAANGYRFAADYRALDGGKKITSTGAVNRKYYESSNDVAFAATNPSTGITQIDAVMYCNHLVSGKVGSLKVNGALIGRDEGIIFSGSVAFNWDIRIGSDSPDGIDIDIYLPRTLQRPQAQYWREVRQ